MSAGGMSVDQQVLAAPFESILFDRPTDSAAPDEPSFFTDLNLDQVLESMTVGPRGVRPHGFLLDPFARRRGGAVPTRDPARSRAAGGLRSRSGVRGEDAADARPPRPGGKAALQVAKRKRWLLDAVEIYCDAVDSLEDELEALELESAGIRAFREYLGGYAGSESFTLLAGGMRTTREALSDVTYTVRIRGDRVEVGRYADEADYSAEVEETFARFRQGAVKDYRVSCSSWPDMNHVEAERPGPGGPAPSRTSSRRWTTSARRHGDYPRRDDRRASTGRSSSTWPIWSTSRRCRRPGCRSATRRVSARSKEICAEDGLRPRPGRASSSREGSPGRLQRLPPGGPGADPRRVRAQPGRQDDLRPHLRAAALPGQPRLPGARPARPGCSSSTRSSPTSSGRRTSRTCAASSRTTWSASTQILERGHRRAASSS